MKLPTQKQIDAGNLIAEELIDASCRKSFAGLGGCKAFDINEFKFKELAQAYVNDEIDSVTAIWIAMNEAEEPQCHPMK